MFHLCISLQAQFLWDQSKLTFVAHRGATARWWTPSYSHVSRDATTVVEPVIVAYVTDGMAAPIDAMSEAEAQALGMGELSNLLGQ